MNADAAELSIQAVPTAWRLQNYHDGGNGRIVIWYTGASTCTPSTAQGLSLPVAATATEKSRLWNTIAMAKSQFMKVIVFYDSATCVISSFALEPE